MKFCQPHWEQLKNAIKVRGLFDFVSSSGMEAVTKTSADQSKAENFEPLMGSHNMIVANALQAGGLYMMGTKEDGTPYCPVCEAEKHGHTGWIDKAADAALEHSKTLK